MDKIADLIVRQKKKVIVIFLTATAICAVLSFFVKVNYNMVDYLPPGAQSTTALDIMSSEFTEAMPNASVMVKDVSVMEAVEYKKKLAALPGVTQVMWLDDMIDIKQPLEMSDRETVEGFYKDGSALFSVTIAKGTEQDTTAAIQELIGEGNAVAGEAPDMATVQRATSREAGGAMLLLVPIIILILALSTSSWMEPVLFLLNIGVAILINMGTNLLLGEISFMSFSVSPILQLAVSLDYAVFLLHSFGDNRKKYADADEAMKHSIKESMSTIAASAVTTLFGFLALMFMNFRIGADLGLTLAKGIVFSFVTAVVFLPAVTLCTYRLIDRFRHRELMPGFQNIHRVLSKLAVPVVLIVALLLVPAFLGQRQTQFVYGNENLDVSSRSSQDSVRIKEIFGQSTVMALLVPRGDVAREQALCDDLRRLEHVTGVMSYASTVDSAIPPEYLGREITSQFYSDNYARIIVYTNTASEGDAAFSTVENIQSATMGYYSEDSWSLGQSANLYDMKNLVEIDNVMVNLVAVIAIFLVLLATFRSAVLPFLLLITIEAGIWINLSIPYFMGTPINFIGYLVLSTVQLGATVDYAILLTTTYMRHRKTMGKKEAVRTALGGSFKSILVSGATLAAAGFILSATTSNPAIGDIGLLLGRGTILSMLMVTCFLPAMLTLLDRAIGKTTFNSGFFDRLPQKTGGFQ